MYIDINGYIEEDLIKKIKDTIDYNMRIDILDIPFNKIGIQQNFSKSSVKDVQDFLINSVNSILSKNKILTDAQVVMTEVNVDTKDFSHFVIKFKSLLGNFELEE